jgi:hypothetical protein
MVCFMAREECSFAHRIGLVEPQPQCLSVIPHVAIELSAAGDGCVKHEDRENADELAEADAPLVA